MSIALAIFAIILGVLGIVGSIVPALPGPPLSWFGLLLMFLRSHFYAAGDPFSSTALLIWLGITILVTVLDYIVPSWMTNHPRFDCRSFPRRNHLRRQFRMDIHEIRIGRLRRFHPRHRHETDSLRPYALEDNGLHVRLSYNFEKGR